MLREPTMVDPNAANRELGIKEWNERLGIIIREVIASEFEPFFTTIQPQIMQFSNELAARLDSGGTFTQPDDERINSFIEATTALYFAANAAIGQKFSEIVGNNILVAAYVGNIMHDVKNDIFLRNIRNYQQRLRTLHYQDGQVVPKVLYEPVEASQLSSTLQVEIEHATSTSDVRKQISRIVENERSLIELEGRENISIELEMPDNEVNIKHNQEITSKVLSQLINNAIDAMPNGGLIQVKISTNGDGVKISVSDNGPGIAPESLAKVTEQGYTTKTGGTDQGLFLARQYIEELLNGKFEVSSTVGVGTEITITLPAVENQ